MGALGPRAAAAGAGRARVALLASTPGPAARALAAETLGPAALLPVPAPRAPRRAPAAPRPRALAKASTLNLCCNTSEPQFDAMKSSCELKCCDFVRVQETARTTHYELTVYIQ